MRIHAEQAFRSLPASASPARRLQALKEWLIISLHTVQPPEYDASSSPLMPPLSLSHRVLVSAQSRGRREEAEARRHAQEGGRRLHARHDHRAL